MGKKSKEIINKQKLKQNKIIITFITFIVLIALVYGFYTFYKVVNARIINSSIHNMEELSLHDKKSIISSLEHRWVNVKGIATEIRLLKLKNIEDMQNQLMIKAQTIDCIEVDLITDTGKVFSSRSEITEKDEDLLNLCESSADEFAYRRDNQATHADARKELLMVGAKIKQFTI